MTLRIFPDDRSLARGAAGAIRDLIVSAIDARGVSRVVLAGGGTPAATYRALSGMKLPWEKTAWYFGDERMVPAAHPESNARMARENLFQRLPGAPFRIHTIDGTRTPGEAARAYEGLLRQARTPGTEHRAPLFDLVLLGLGADGHTASLFPDDGALDSNGRWALPVLAPPGHAVRERVTLTVECIHLSRERWFLVSGGGKREILARVLTSNPTPSLPATLLADGATWFVDRAAAGSRE
ncbi:MAG: 6-phosphogluconolactonase [Gemmatimonadales bacterium]